MSRDSRRGLPSPDDDPTGAEVREALWWALENDWAAVVEHRATAHATRNAGFRRQADRELVQRWRRAVRPSARRRTDEPG